MLATCPHAAVPIGTLPSTEAPETCGGCDGAVSDPADVEVFLVCGGRAAEVSIRNLLMSVEISTIVCINGTLLPILSLEEGCALGDDDPTPATTEARRAAADGGCGVDDVAAVEAELTVV